VGSGHSHTAGSNRRRLFIALGLSLLVLVVEVVGASLSGSLALLADAGHVLTDVAGLLIAIVALTAAARPATPTRTFGYLRLEVLAAGFNALLLFGIAGWIGFEAWQRWQEPTEISSGIMLVFAAAGLVANVIGLRLLRVAAATSINVKGAYMEMWGDLVGSVCVILAALAIAITGWERVDPIASLVVVVLIVPRAWMLLREVIAILLETTPSDVDLQEVRAHWLSKSFVISVHDMHAWTITSGLPVLSAHVVVKTEALADGTGPILVDLAACLDGHFNIEHSTIQIEPEGHALGEHAMHG
jgi:cobalt-zinc-cadmium efflux system protein